MVFGLEVISDDQQIANTFNKFFDEAVSSLDIEINPYLLNDPGNLENPVDIALKKFESHPSILSVKNNVEINLLLYLTKSPWKICCQKSKV